MSYKVLVVDDEKDLRELISYFLKREGYEIGTAENGREAFEKIQSWQPQLVISDIRMPVWDGFELIRNVAKISAPVSILFISGYVGGDEEELRKNPHCAGFIPKPVHKNDLIRIVKEFREQSAPP